MSHSLTAAQRGRKEPGDTLNLAVSFDKALEAGLALTGAPTITIAPSGGGHLTASNPAVTAAARTILGKSVPAGRAVTFTVAGGQAGTTYAVKITVTNNATPAETLNRYVLIDVASS
jgi:hypothetical protein